MKSIIPFAVLLGVCVALSAEAGAKEPTPAKLQMEFADQAAEPKWAAENDGVMGGKSQGRVEITGGSLIFSGTLSFENNGGFASVVTNERKHDLTGATDLKLRVKGDGRTYRLRLSTDAQHRGSSIVYMADFTTQAGKWEELKIPFSSFKPSHHGNDLEGPVLNLSKIEEIGFLIGDKRAEPFALTVDWMKTE